MTEISSRGSVSNCSAPKLRTNAPSSPGVEAGCSSSSASTPNVGELAESPHPGPRNSSYVDSPSSRSARPPRSIPTRSSACRRRFSHMMRSTPSSSSSSYKEFHATITNSPSTGRPRPTSTSTDREDKYSSPGEYRKRPNRTGSCTPRRRRRRRHRVRRRKSSSNRMRDSRQRRGGNRRRSDARRYSSGRTTTPNPPSRRLGPGSGGDGISRDRRHRPRGPRQVRRRRARWTGN